MKLRHKPRSAKYYWLLAHCQLALGIAWVFTPWKNLVAAVWLLSVFTQYRTEMNNFTTAQAREEADAGTDD